MDEALNLIVITLLFLYTALMVFITWYQCFQFTTRLHRSAAAAPKRLNPSILKEIPVMVYSAITQEGTLECAVCLSEFQDGDEVRVLPACKHTFHSVCIDLWFRSHSTCPLCRAPVRKMLRGKEIPAAEAVQTAELRREEDNERLCAASSSSPPATLLPVQCEKIMPDLVGILVEEPTSSGFSGSVH